VRIHGTCLSALFIAVLTGCAANTVNSGAPSGTLQKGSLANQQLIRDALVGVNAKAGALGCTKKIDSFQPYVLAMPHGSPGSRVWWERWVIVCGEQTYPIDIRFNESGLGAADYTIK
jgi:hypothetical protein